MDPRPTRTRFGTGSKPNSIPVRKGNPSPFRPERDPSSDRSCTPRKGPSQDRRSFVRDASGGPSVHGRAGVGPSNGHVIHLRLDWAGQYGSALPRHVDHDCVQEDMNLPCMRSQPFQDASAQQDGDTCPVRRVERQHSNKAPSPRPTTGKAKMFAATFCVQAVVGSCGYATPTADIPPYPMLAEMRESWAQTCAGTRTFELPAKLSMQCTCSNRPFAASPVDMKAALDKHSAAESKISGRRADTAECNLCTSDAHLSILCASSGMKDSIASIRKASGYFSCFA
mmetsp:Transcript_2130/g.13931  ORF Transcript_2130/g.13931 Transcript_2130/m.13931 type:complete len:283 (+) Transcript_2130:2056-2904(+)